VLSVPLLERHTPLTVATYPILFGGPFVLLLSSPQLLNLGWGRVGVEGQPRMIRTTIIAPDTNCPFGY